MVERIKPLVKNNPQRERKRIILVGVEGANKTEKLYFRELEKTQKQYHFLFADGNETDPVGITRNTVKKRKKESLDRKKGDIAVSIFDLDADKTKAPLLERAKKIANEGMVSIMTSNPCFEVWYLEHFKYTTKQFANSTEAIDYLKQFIPDYEKNTCDFSKLYPNTDSAIKHCIRLEKHHEDSGDELVSEFANPRTDIYKLVEVLLEE